MNTKQIETILRKLNQRLAKSHPNEPEEIRQIIATQIYNDVMLIQGLNRVDEISDDDWGELVEGFLNESDEEMAEMHFVGENQIACRGWYLTSMLNDEGVNEDTYKRLNLTSYAGDFDGTEITLFKEIEDEMPYLITWNTNEENFDICDAIRIEPFDEARFEQLVADDEAEADKMDESYCDNECESCSQECVGKKTL